MKGVHWLMPSKYTEGTDPEYKSVASNFVCNEFKFIYSKHKPF